ncbi:MAG: hypothetical protein OXC11_14225 [Rhodospirillales bacterium]|nr:hypothetical protein [Rhodospirillales bacterium]
MACFPVPVPPGNPDRIGCDAPHCEALAVKWCDCEGMALCRVHDGAVCQKPEPSDAPTLPGLEVD